MKIVWISHGNTLYGAERCLLEFVEATYKEHENYIVFPDSGKIVELCSPFAKQTEIIKTGWWVSFPGGSARDYLRKYFHIMKSIFLLIRFLKKVQPDLVISNSLVIVHGAIAAKMLGIPHLLYIHEYVEEDHNLHFDLGLKTSCFFINKLTRCFLVNATGVKNKFQKYLPVAKMHLLKYIINVPKYEVPVTNKHQLELLLSGRVAPNKGQLDAILALKVLRDKDYDIHLTLIGIQNDDYSLKIKETITSNNLSGYVTLIEFCENPFVYYSTADICLVTSKMEAFGRITIEAMKLGKPVIGTATGETPYLIEVGQTGFLYEYGNFNQLASKIEYCYLNPGELETMKRNALNYSDTNYSEDIFNSSFNQILKSAVFI